MKRDILFLGRRQGDFSQEIGRGNYVLNAEFVGRSRWFLPWFCPRLYFTLSWKARSRSKNHYFLPLHVRHCALPLSIPLVNYTTPGSKKYFAFYLCHAMTILPFFMMGEPDAISVLVPPLHRVMVVWRAVWVRRLGNLFLMRPRTFFVVVKHSMMKNPVKE